MNNQNQLAATAAPHLRNTIQLNLTQEQFGKLNGFVNILERIEDELLNTALLVDSTASLSIPTANFLGQLTKENPTDQSDQADQVMTTIYGVLCSIKSLSDRHSSDIFEIRTELAEWKRGGDA